jgi:hypothetical protein
LIWRFRGRRSKTGKAAAQSRSAARRIELGLEVKADYTQGGFGWLTVGVADQAGPEITLDVRVRR